MTERVSSDDLRLAAEWLDHNEGEEDGEAERCKKVANWLRAEANKREREMNVRAMARQTGQPAKRVRDFLKRQEA